MAFNAKRLAIARRRRGLTKAALADQVGVSSRMITAYEGGEKAPGSDSLSKLSDVLQFPSAFFSGDDLSEPALADVSFRALRSLTARRRDQALGSAALALEFARWIDSKFELPDVDLPLLEEIGSESAAIETRQEWGLSEERAPNRNHL
ncbi:MAG: helix-turn-helix transcriptional regulator, partial [Chloroflexi bacterium]|nr:helix-turn-helix transcriptional regulator [Chloroflexota bacterium]